MLDCLTGKVTERVGEVVLDGSESWNSYAIENDKETQSFYIPLPNAVDESFISNTLKKVINVNDLGIDYECLAIRNGYLQLRIMKSKLESNDVNSFKKYLSQNPITVQYQLKTESIKIVDLDVVDQDGNAIPKIKSYKDVTHLEVTVPKQSLLPHISAEVATDNSKDMSLLTTKHREISEAQSAIQDNIQSQSDEIDTALMATTEIFESILE